MKLSTVLVTALATLTTAGVVPGQHPQMIEEREVVNIGGDLIFGLVEMIAGFPGIEEIKNTFECMAKDKSWTADYSKKGEGIVTFTDLPTKCCNIAQAGWKKYQKDWHKLATPVFNNPCNGGSLTKMMPSHIDKLHRVIGEGRGEK